MRGRCRLYAIHQNTTDKITSATLTRGLLEEKCLEKDEPGSKEWLWLTRELLKLLAKTSEQSLKENTAHSNAKYAMADSKSP